MGVVGECYVFSYLRSVVEFQMHHLLHLHCLNFALHFFDESSRNRQQFKWQIQLQKLWWIAVSNFILWLQGT